MLFYLVLQLYIFNWLNNIGISTAKDKFSELYMQVPVLYTVPCRIKQGSQTYKLILFYVVYSLRHLHTYNSTPVPGRAPEFFFFFLKELIALI